MDRKKIVDYYLQKLSDKDFEIYQVRQDLERNNFEEEEIRIIVRLVDSALQRKVLADMENKKSMTLVRVGAVLTVMGAGITIGTYTGIIPMGDSFLLTYGPFLGGLSILVTGAARRRS